jgi:hypothetical protein
MAWRAAATLELPTDNFDALEVEHDEDDSSAHEMAVKGLLAEVQNWLSPGLYNVKISGHYSEDEEDHGDNLNININRTTE